MHESHHLMTGTLSRGDEDNPDVRILRRVSTLDKFPLQPRGEGPVRRIAVVDTETTGTDPLTDEIIDIAVVVLEVDEAGEIVGVAQAGQALRDPGMPIPPHITMLTGITDEDVCGRTIDLDRLERLLASADVRVAHSAAFDIAFIENLMPGLAGEPWACSMEDFDWLGTGFDGRKLGHLLMQCRWFNSAHRAMADVISLIHVLSHRLTHGGTVLGELLAHAAKSSTRFEATNAPYHLRGLLKARGYRWDPRHRVWWCEIDECDCAKEERWFREHIAASGPVPRMLPMTWRERHR
ncbi:3'-5' exonuclease [Stakelama marina]|uniref:DNA polymerase III subunit epsilon n=1 Tax=Stakelama marina TaxID=2826939 RepID=A0A8T4IFM8_9SPHN|nr:3'-5' exonuclease [Stakelama marina]MBR0551059.1 DNA polymerase III subunit epsilon [Stakelama marina]